jgi:hypothetical protein
MEKSKNIKWIASIDPGKKNFAFCIEEFSLSEIEELKFLNKKNIKENYNLDGTPTLEFNRVLEKVYLNGKVILFLNTNVTQNCDNRLKFDERILKNIITLLDEYINYWVQCDYFIIERQMSFGTKCNLKIAQHCWTYFMLKTRNSRICEFPAYHKTQILGAEKTLLIKRYKPMNKTERKKWTFKKFLEILKKRGDDESIKILNINKKKDDVSDAFCQIQAFKVNNLLYGSI